MMTDEQTPTQAHAQMIQYLDAAATRAFDAAGDCGGRGEWARSVRWGDIGGRITRILSDLVAAGDAQPAPDQPVEDDRSIDQLLVAAEACTRPFGLGQVPGVVPETIVDLLDLAREVRALVR